MGFTVHFLFSQLCFIFLLIRATPTPNTDRTGSDFFWQPTPDYPQCASLCLSNSRCLAWAFAGGMCYLKNPAPGQRYVPGVWSDLRPPDPNIAVSATSCPSTAPTMSLGRENIDRTGGDYRNVPNVPSAAGCSDLCRQDSKCRAWAWAPNTCYLKNVVTPERWSPGTWSGVKDGGPPANAPGHIDENTDRTGNDFYSGGSPSAEACSSWCNADGRCKAWAWGSGTCYLKDPAPPQRPVPGVYSGLAGAEPQPCMPIVNLAPTGTAFQSSTLASYVAFLSIDGNINSFAHTLTGSLTAPAFWQLDLMSTSLIHQVILQNRRDCCDYRLIGAWVLIFPTEPVGLADVLSMRGAAVWAAQVPSSQNDRSSFTFNVDGVRGRYLRVVSDDNPIHIAEVLVMGSKVNIMGPQTGPGDRAVDFDGTSAVLFEYGQRAKFFPVEDLTITFWIKASPNSPPGTILSYFTSGPLDPVFGIHDPANLLIVLGGQALRTPLSLADGVWVFAAITWSRATGLVSIYKEGLLAYPPTVLGKGFLFENTGMLVLGQRQHARGGGFIRSEAFVGVLDEVAVYDSVLDSHSLVQVRAQGTFVQAPHLMNYWTFDNCADRLITDEKDRVPGQQYKLPLGCTPSGRPTEPQKRVHFQTLEEAQQEQAQEDQLTASVQQAYDKAGAMLKQSVAAQTQAKRTALKSISASAADHWSDPKYQREPPPFSALTAFQVLEFLNQNNFCPKGQKVRSMNGTQLLASSQSDIESDCGALEGLRLYHELQHAAVVPLVPEDYDVSPDELSELSGVDESMPEEWDLHGVPAYT